MREASLIVGHAPSAQKQMNRALTPVGLLTDEILPVAVYRVVNTRPSFRVLKVVKVVATTK